VEASVNPALTTASKGAPQAAGGFDPGKMLGAKWGSMSGMEKGQAVAGLASTALGAAEEPQAPPPIVSSPGREPRPAQQLPVSNEYLELLRRVKAKIRPARGVIGAGIQ
jgi:hypothetical protein